MASIDELDLTKNELRNKIIEYAKTRLGSGLVDVELDPIHFNVAIDQAIMKYRQKAQNATEESYGFLPLLMDTQVYTMPKEVMAVRQIFRRGIGSTTGSTASQFEPFTSGYLNTYMLAAGRVGGMLSYELFAQYQELAMTMFGGYINYTFSPSTKKLTLIRKIPADGETVMLWLYNYKPEVVLLQDYLAYPWIQDYAYALCTHMLGEGREKFAQIAGPQGGSSLNGTALKAEAKELMDKLEEDLKNFVDGSTPAYFVIG